MRREYTIEHKLSIEVRCGLAFLEGAIIRTLEQGKGLWLQMRRSVRQECSGEQHRAGQLPACPLDLPPSLLEVRSAGLAALRHQDDPIERATGDGRG